MNNEFQRWVILCNGKDKRGRFIYSSWNDNNQTRKTARLNMARAKKESPYLYYMLVDSTKYDMTNIIVPLS